MTYGTFLRQCRQRAGGGKLNKTDFSRRLGMANPEHYIGNENDKPGRKPSLDLLERAAREAGFEFTECIQFPTKEKRQRLTVKLRQDVTTIEELLALGDPEIELWFHASTKAFAKAYLQRR